MCVNWFTPKYNLIKDSLPLDVEYMPKSVNEIVNREKEIDKMRAHFSGVFQKEIPRPMFIYGAPGTGKTMLAKLISQKLISTANEENLQVFCPYVNCSISNSTYEIFKSLAEQYALKTKQFPPKATNSAAYQFNNFITSMNLYKGISIIILDEIDKCNANELIYKITRPHEGSTVSNKVGLVCISNNLKYTSSLEKNTLSSLAHKELYIHQYNAVELYDIIKVRADLALVPGTISDELLQRCAALTTKRDSDARKAITLLRDAVETAQQYGLEAVTEEIVIECDRSLKQEQDVEIIGSLSLQLKVALFATILSINTSTDSESTVGNAFNIYKSSCAMVNATPFKSRAFANILNELEMYDMIEIEKVSRGRGKGIRNIITTSADMHKMITLVLKDEQLTDLSELITEQ